MTPPVRPQGQARGAVARAPRRRSARRSVREVVQLARRGSAGISSVAQPRQPPPGAGSPMPTVIESPSAANRVMPIASLRAVRRPRERRGSPGGGRAPVGCSARARAAARRDRSGRASTARTPAARSSPATLAPASPHHLGQRALRAHHRHRGPAAPAPRSAASPEGLRRPGADGYVGGGERRGPGAGGRMKPTKVTGSPARGPGGPGATAADRRRRPPGGPARPRRAAWPAWSASAAASSRPTARPQWTSRVWPWPTYRARTGPAQGETRPGPRRGRTRGRFAAPIRPNSAAAQSVVQMTRCRRARCAG